MARNAKAITSRRQTYVQNEHTRLLKENEYLKSELDKTREEIKDLKAKLTTK